MSVELPPAPSLGPPPAGGPPSLPTAWSGVAMLTPFAADQIAVARVGYSSSANVMHVEVAGLEWGFTEYMQVGNDTYWRFGPHAPWNGPKDYGWQVPAPTLLGDQGATCLGTGEVLGVDCAWWASASPCTNGCEGDDCPPTVGTWTWLRSDDGLPWRMVFVDKGNPYRLAAIGTYAMVNWVAFEAADDTSLAAELDAIRASAVNGRATPDSATNGDGSDGDASDGAGPDGDGSNGDGSDGAAEHARQQLLALIPELQLPPESPQLPWWPDRLYMTALTLPTSELAVLPTQVFYDWPEPVRSMLTRLWDPSTGGHDDLILDGGRTHTIHYDAEGKRTGCDKPEFPGLPKPQWPSDDNGVVRAVIGAGSVLSPYGPTQLIVLPSDHGRVFWIWYTTDNRAVLFTEVPQLCDVGLVLVDYVDYVPDPTFDPTMFEIPTGC